MARPGPSGPKQVETASPWQLGHADGVVRSRLRAQVDGRHWASPLPEMGTAMPSPPRNFQPRRSFPLTWEGPGFRMTLLSVLVLKPEPSRRALCPPFFFLRHGGLPL
jgi:hypothetical protein